MGCFPLSTSQLTTVMAVLLYTAICFMSVCECVLMCTVSVLLDILSMSSSVCMFLSENYSNHCSLSNC